MRKPTASCSQYLLLKVAPLSVLVGLAVAGAPSPADATTSINMDEFSVTENGSPLFDDSFNQNTMLNGVGLGSTVASGVNFAGSTTGANYFVRGSIPESTANNGQALLNVPANGVVVTQPRPVLRRDLRCPRLSRNPHKLHRGKRVDAGDLVHGDWPL